MKQSKILTQAENRFGLYSALRARITTRCRSSSQPTLAVAVTLTIRSSQPPCSISGPIVCASIAFSASDRVRLGRPAVTAPVAAPEPPALRRDNVMIQRSAPLTGVHCESCSLQLSLLSTESLGTHRLAGAGSGDWASCQGQQASD